MNLQQLRSAYHETVCRGALGQQTDVPNIADSASAQSVVISQAMLGRIGCPLGREAPPEVVAHTYFVAATYDFIEHALHMIEHLRPGQWMLRSKSSPVSGESYEDLTELARVLVEHLHGPLTCSDIVLGADILVGRNPVLTKSK